MTKKVRRIAWGLCLALYVLSLILPVTIQYGQFFEGIGVLVIGWMAVLYLQLAWFANFFFLVALLLLIFDARSRVGAFLIAIPLILLTMEACLPGMSPGDLQGFKWGPNPHTEPQGDGPGYYLWILAMFGTAGALIANVMMTRPVEPAVDQQFVAS
jgi:hypothetical protein